MATRVDEIVRLIRAVSGSADEDAISHDEAVALIDRHVARVAAPVVGTGIPPALPYGWTQEHAAKAAWMIGTLAITPIEEWKSKAEIYATLSEFRFLSTGKSTPLAIPHPETAVSP